MKEKDLAFYFGSLWPSGRAAHGQVDPGADEDGPPEMDRGHGLAEEEAPEHEPRDRDQVVEGGGPCGPEHGHAPVPPDEAEDRADRGKEEEGRPDGRRRCGEDRPLAPGRLKDGEREDQDGPGEVGAGRDRDCGISPGEPPTGDRVDGPADDPGKEEKIARVEPEGEEGRGRSVRDHGQDAGRREGHAEPLVGLEPLAEEEGGQARP